MRTALILSAWFAPLAMPVVAQEAPYSLPNGCEAYVTIQLRDCVVAHHFTCEGDPEGYQRRVDIDEDGVAYAGTIDAEAQWIESFHLRSGHVERLERSPADRSSMTELMASDLDTWDFVTNSDEIGPTRYVGEDRLTGERVEIDGVTLWRTEYEFVAYGPDGSELWRGQGREFIHPDWRMFIAGQSTYTLPDETFSTDGEPVEFIFPGEPGFLSRNPKHGCGMMMSMLTPDPVLEIEEIFQ